MNKTRFAICLLFAATLLPAAGTSKSTSKTGSAPSAKAKTKAKKPGASIDSAAKPDASRLTDSLFRKEKDARAVDSLRRADSLGRIADSLRRVDSLGRVADSIRRADSTALAERTWSVAVPAGSFHTPEGGSRLQERLEIDLRRAGKVRFVHAAPDSTGDPLSAARRAEAGKVLQIQVAEDSTGAVGWSAKLSASASGIPLDSAQGRIASGKLVWSRVSRAVIGHFLGIHADSAVRPAPAPTIWTWVVGSDVPNREFLPKLDSALPAAFASHPDRKFLGHISPVDSFATARGATRILSIQLTGKPKAWEVHAQVRPPHGAVVDSLVLARTGPRSRVFAWFAKHLAAIGNDPRPQDTCTEATRRQAGKWAIVDDSGSTPATAKLVADLRSQSRGRLAELPSPLPCRDRACLDSLAQSRSIGRILEVRADASGARVRALDVRTDDWIDSADIRESRAERLPIRVWNAIAPLPGCELCVPDDTLEGALALVVHPWIGSTDSAVAAYRDSVARVLAQEGDYLVLPPATSAAWTPEALPDSFARAELRCRTGAARVLTISVEKDSTGWRTHAILSDAKLGTGIRTLSATDKHRRAARPVEMASWTARRILGTETREEAPDPHAFPWSKALWLGIPAVLGVGSTILHW